MSKARRSIAPEDILRVFNDECIEALARLGKLPAHADKQLFAEGIREAARIYARDSRQPTSSEVHAEIKKLHHAAERRQYDRLPSLVAGLSSKARDFLNKRGARPTLKLALPNPEDLRGAQRAEACATIERLTQIGGHYVAGRMRPTGKRSRPTWRPELHAPKPSRHSQKREAERYFITMLQFAWTEATEKLPSMTARRGMLGPFAKMVQECLRLVGAGHADVVGLLNDIHRDGLSLSLIKA